MPFCASWCQPTARCCSASISNWWPLPWRRPWSHQANSHYTCHCGLSLLKDLTSKRLGCYRKFWRSWSVVYLAWLFSHDPTDPISVDWGQSKRSLDFRSGSLNSSLRPLTLITCVTLGNSLPYPSTFPRLQKTMP